MRVLVTGGTGFVGSALVRRLLADGHEVHVVTRGPARAAGTLPVRATACDWDGDALREALAGTDAVVNLAGAGIADARWSDARKRLIRASRIDRTREVVTAIEALAPADRPRAFLSASAIGWYGDRGDEELTEASAAGEGFLADVCRDWEEAARPAAALGVRTTAVRIGVVLGPGGGALARLLPPFRLGLGGRLGSGSHWLGWIHRDDLVALLIHLLDQPDAPAVVNAVAPAPVTNATFTRELGTVLRRPTVAHVPAVALRLALGEMSTVLLGSQRALPRATVATAFRFRFPTLGDALRDVCRDPSHELELEQWLPRTPDEIFAFFADPHNLERITPGFLGFRILRVTEPTLREGVRIDYRLSLHGIPVRWQSVISRWDPPRTFVDDQAKGPYALWHHVHEFEPWNGGTIVRDRARYALPLGALGDLVAGWVVRRDLAAIFAFRRARLGELLG